MPRLWRCVTLLGAATLGAAAAGCCRDRQEIARYPLAVRFLQYADTLSTAGTDTIWVGAQVGFEGCTLENARLERRGDSLVVGGNARCAWWRRCGDAGTGIGAPVRDHSEIVPLTLPQLDAGAYFLDAGSFVDTLTVAAGPASSRVRITADGFFVTPWLPCPRTTPFFFVGLPADVALIYEIVQPSTAPQTGEAHIRSVLEGASACAVTGIAGRLRLQWFVPRGVRVATP